MQSLLVSSPVEHWQLDVSLLLMIGNIPGVDDDLTIHSPPQRVPRLPSEEL
jgi:hypothetical protein